MLTCLETKDKRFLNPAAILIQFVVVGTNITHFIQQVFNATKVLVVSDVQREKKGLFGGNLGVAEARHVLERQMSSGSAHVKVSAATHLLVLPCWSGSCSFNVNFHSAAEKSRRLHSTASSHCCHPLQQHCKDGAVAAVEQKPEESSWPLIFGDIDSSRLHFVLV